MIEKKPDIPSKSERQKAFIEAASANVVVDIAGDLACSVEYLMS